MVTPSTRGSDLLRRRELVGHVPGGRVGRPSGMGRHLHETPNTDVLLFHVDLTLRYSETSAAFNTGLYVQTFNGVLNYVTCYGQVGPTGHYWGVLEATGNTLSATNFVQLWTSAISTTGPSTEDCTIVTNGSNLLTVYMDGAAVYSSTNAGLNMPEPFNAYLEVESGYSGGMLYASYRDYYATTSDYVMVHSVPAGDTVKIVSGSQVLEEYHAHLGDRGARGGSIRAASLRHARGALREYGGRDDGHREHMGGRRLPIQRGALLLLYLGLFDGDFCAHCGLAEHPWESAHRLLHRPSLDQAATRSDWLHHCDIHTDRRAGLPDCGRQLRLVHVQPLVRR